MDVHRLLALPKEIPAFDVNQSCDGFLYGLWLASRIGKTLLVCFDMLRFEQSPIESLIFSDAACVAVIHNKELEPFSLEFYNDGLGADKLYSNVDGNMKMDGGAVYDFATSKVPELVKKMQSICGPHDFLVQHQPNLSMMKIIDKRCGFDGASLRSVEKYGNQSMVSIPTALASNEDRILGAHVLMVGYGAGYSAAAGCVVWPNSPICKVIEI